MSEKVPSKLKRYIETNVYEESKKRIHHIFDTFDTVITSFSGGKDSLVTLHLMIEVMKERGITTKPKFVFRDEELIMDEVIDFVMSYCTDEFDFQYFAVPMQSQKFILGKTYQYVQWDTNREWLRDKPSFALSGDEGVIYDQYSMDELVTRNFSGKIAILTGIRADESLIRFRSCINKRNENYINATQVANVKLCKPIYDWSEIDIFKYLYEKDIPYCVSYDMQLWNGDSFRISTPLHAESSKVLYRLKTAFPTFYAQLMNLFPEMSVQELYWNEFDKYGVIYQYERSWNGIVQYIKDNITDKEERKKAINQVIQCKKMRDKRYANGQQGENFGGFPVMYVFKAILSGGYKRQIQPTQKPTKEEVEYEHSIKGN